MPTSTFSPICIAPRVPRSSSYIWSEHGRVHDVSSAEEKEGMNRQYWTSARRNSGTHSKYRVYSAKEERHSGSQQVLDVSTLCHHHLVFLLHASFKIAQPLEYFLLNEFEVTLRLPVTSVRFFPQWLQLSVFCLSQRIRSYASPPRNVLVMAQSRYVQHLLWARMTLFFCAIHPVLWMCATVSSGRCSITACSYLLSLLQSSHRGLARAPIICSHFPHGKYHHNHLTPPRSTWGHVQSTIACASFYRVRESRGCHLFLLLLP